MTGPPALRLGRTVLPILAFVILLAPPAASALTSTENSMAQSLSHVRQDKRLAGVQVSPALSRACRSYAAYMMRHGRWAHAQRRGKTGEILAVWPGRTGGPSQIVRAWLNSPTHRRVILNGHFTRVGVASRYGRFRGRLATLWVVRFAR
jgi:uncharacterized protein YkwD